MKMNRALVLAATLLATFGLPSSTVFGQGALNPPGAPAPAMKTLEEIEPRIPISSLPLTITNSGSYFLTTNLAGGLGGGITIEASDVTLDLMGFTLANGTGSGINVSDTSSNIRIHSGTIRE